MNLENILGHLEWCRLQCHSIMGMAGHTDENTQRMIESTASDIEINLSMMKDELGLTATPDCGG